MTRWTLEGGKLLTCSGRAQAEQSNVMRHSPQSGALSTCLAKKQAWALVLRKGQQLLTAAVTGMVVVVVVVVGDLGDLIAA